VTVCSDLLKSGGYLRMLQYFETLESAMADSGASDLADYTVKTSEAGGDVAAAGLANLRGYAARVRTEPRMHKMAFDTAHSKTPRSLDLFDCIEAPCVDECPVDQAVPQYMEAVRTGDYAKAVSLTRSDNPVPTILGHVCDHLCEHTCIRTHYDEPLAIREMKRFIMSREIDPSEVAAVNGMPPVAVIGAGPCGLASAERLAFAGHPVTVFEMYPYAGGMVGGAIPTYRLPQAVIDQDLAPLERLGVEFRFGVSGMWWWRSGRNWRRDSDWMARTPTASPTGSLSSAVCARTIRSRSARRSPSLEPATRRWTVPAVRPASVPR